MAKLVFPSAEFPAQPAVTLQIPEGWVPVQAPGAVMAARSAAGDGAFVSNVVVRIERRPLDFELGDAVAELRAFAIGRPEGTTSEPFTTDLDGRVFVGCDVSWVDDRAGTVLQAHLFGGVPTGRYLHLVQVTGSVGGAQAREEYPAIKEIMKSLTVTSGERRAP